MKRLLFLILIMFCITVSADESYNKVIVIYKADDEVAIIVPIAKVKGPNETEHNFLQRIHEESTIGTELEGLPYEFIDKTDLPASRVDRKYWTKKQGKQFKINQTKKDADIAKKEDKAQKEQSGKDKLEDLGLTTEEIEALLEH